MPVLNQSTITDIARTVKMDTIAEHVKSGHCILFLGSGVHYHSDDYGYPKETRPPLGRELSEKLAEKCDFSKHFANESAGNMQRVAMCYEIEQSRGDLVKELKRLIQDSKAPSPALRALAALPFPLIVTTNYDNFLDRAFIEHGKDPRVATYDKEGSKPTADYGEPDVKEPVIFKIHGDFKSLESIVITDEDYIQFVLRMTGKGDFYPIPKIILYHLQIWPTLFIGYSLLDYNLRLLFKTLRWKLDQASIPKAYSVDPKPDPLIFDVWNLEKKHVTFIAQDVWTFVPDLYKRIIGKEMQKKVEQK